ncbi:small multi-drug export protein [Alteribacillus sp. HJP-4]|uniref:small multi-drug export protein n=1 Tax=Alteribacillus sp. HJP-4 TaxID=2775394 RepID=UPI0035CCEA04
MTLIIAYVFIFILAATPFLEVVGVIPIGAAAGLPVIPVTIFSFLGNIATILLLILLMDQVKAWMQKRREKKGRAPSQKRAERAERLWKKFGLPGVALLSPFLIGSHLGAVLAMGFGGTKQQIAIWMTISVFSWSVLVGIGSYYGIDFLYNQTGREGFLVDLLEVD